MSSAVVTPARVSAWAATSPGRSEAEGDSFVDAMTDDLRGLVFGHRLRGLDAAEICRTRRSAAEDDSEAGTQQVGEDAAHDGLCEVSTGRNDALHGN